MHYQLFRAFKQVITTLLHQKPVCSCISLHSHSFEKTSLLWLFILLKTVKVLIFKTNISSLKLFSTFLKSLKYHLQGSEQFWLKLNLLPHHLFESMLLTSTMDAHTLLFACLIYTVVIGGRSIKTLRWKPTNLFLGLFKAWFFQHDFLG